MMILACDTSTKFLSLAVVRDDKIIKNYHSDKRGTSDYLFVVIDIFLKELDIHLSDFDLFAIGEGPGSFTGLRIGTCAFKTFAFSLDKPLIAVNSFDAIASNFKGEKKLICVIEDAKKTKVYAAMYKLSNSNSLEIKQKSTLFSIDSLLEKMKEETVFTGAGIEVYGEKISSFNKDFSLAKEKFWYPKAEIIANLAKEKFKKGEVKDPTKLIPLYLHSERANITKPKKLI